jgi:hypothetical protein
MLTLEEGAGTDRVFRLVEDQVKGKGGPRTELKTKIALRDPSVMLLDEALIGDDKLFLAEFQRLSTKYRHFFVSFACTFLPDASESLLEAEVKVDLSSQEECDNESSIYSLRPDRLEDAIEIKGTAKLGVDFKLAKIDLGVEGDIKRKIPFLLAFPLGNRAVWRFSKTESSQISGLYPLQVVVRSPVTAKSASGRIDVSVRVGTRLFFIRSIETNNQVAAVEFVCG